MKLKRSKPRRSKLRRSKLRRSKDGVKRKYDPTTEEDIKPKRSKYIEDSSLEKLFSNIDEDVDLDNISEKFDTIFIHESPQTKIMNKIKLIEQYKKYLEKEIEKEYIKINFEEGKIKKRSLL